MQIKSLRQSKVTFFLHQKLYGGVKKIILPNQVKPYRILGGPGKGNLVYLNIANGNLRKWLGLYEPPLMRWLSNVVKPGFTVYEIGANDGYISLLLAKLVGSSGHVYAFEPEQPHLEMMEANFALNPELAERITVLPYYVGNKHALEQSQCALDVLCLAEGKLPKPDVVQMDVEGAELEVLEGMTAIMSKSLPQVFVECHIGSHIEEGVKNFLTRYNFKVGKAEPSVFETSRAGFNSWIYTK